MTLLIGSLLAWGMLLFCTFKPYIWCEFLAECYAPAVYELIVFSLALFVAFFIWVYCVYLMIRCFWSGNRLLALGNLVVVASVAVVSAYPLGNFNLNASHDSSVSSVIGKKFQVITWDGYVAIWKESGQSATRLELGGQEVAFARKSMGIDPEVAVLKHGDQIQIKAAKRMRQQILSHAILSLSPWRFYRIFPSIVLEARFVNSAGAKIDFLMPLSYLDRSDTFEHVD